MLEVDEAPVRKLVLIYTPLADMVLIAGGSPCEDPSGLNVAGDGLSGQRLSLFFEIPHIFALVESIFNAKVFLMVENVFNMTPCKQASLQ